MSGDARQDAMPITRGLNFFSEDPNLEFVCSTLLPPDVARPHLAALGAIAGDELDALAAAADRHGQTLSSYDQRGRRVDEVVFHPAYREMERLALDALVDWTAVPEEALALACLTA
jgi:hypothetical protein